MLQRLPGHVPTCYIKFICYHNPSKKSVRLVFFIFTFHKIVKWSNKVQLCWKSLIYLHCIFPCESAVERILKISLHLPVTMEHQMLCFSLTNSVSDLFVVLRQCIKSIDFVSYYRPIVWWLSDHLIDGNQCYQGLC